FLCCSLSCGPYRCCPLFPYTSLFRSSSRWYRAREVSAGVSRTRLQLDRQETAPPIGTYSGFTVREMADIVRRVLEDIGIGDRLADRKSTRLNSSHVAISYAVFCLKKK